MPRLPMRVQHGQPRLSRGIEATWRDRRQGSRLRLVAVLAVDVEQDACLVVLPGPTIPFCRSRYFQRGRVRLAPTARLIWGDIWVAGR